MYDIFISYNSKDIEIVESLSKSLRKNKVKVFLDKWGLTPGKPWQEELEEAISKSKTVAIVISEHGLGVWQKEEMRLALDYAVSTKNTKVIPIILPKANIDKIPLFLKRYTWIDFRSGVNNVNSYKKLCDSLGILQINDKNIIDNVEQYSFSEIIHSHVSSKKSCFDFIAYCNTECIISHAVSPNFETRLKIFNIHSSVIEAINNYKEMSLSVAKNLRVSCEDLSIISASIPNKLIIDINKGAVHYYDLGFPEDHETYLFGVTIDSTSVDSGRSSMEMDIIKYDMLKYIEETL